VDLPLLLGLIGEALGQPLVLVVDDDADLCASLWDILRERGYRVGVAADAAAAADQLRDANYQVVLIDMKLPGGDGGDVFWLMRAISPQARAVMITGDTDMEPLVRTVVRDGADAVCYKPFDVPKLLSLLGKLVQQREEPIGMGAGAGGA
jgi:DNA-binding NtrC family response regulator